MTSVPGLLAIGSAFALMKMCGCLPSVFFILQIQLPRTVEDDHALEVMTVKFQIGTDFVIFSGVFRKSMIIVGSIGKCCEIILCRWLSMFHQVVVK